MTTIPEPPADRLAEALHHRAERIEVRPDLGELLARGPAGASDGTAGDPGPTPEPDPLLAGRGPWPAVVIGLLVAGVMAVAALAWAGPSPVVELGADPVPQALAPSSIEVIVWLDPGVDGADVAAVADRLAAEESATAAHYVGTMETWREFREHFVDQPELVELVEPDQLPTSFRVTTTDPAAVEAAVIRLPGVAEVERAP